MKNAIARLTYLLAAVALTACKGAAPLNSLNQSILANPPDTVTIQINGYKPQTGNSFQNLFVSNDSVVVSQGQLLWSTARDSMSDTLKQSLQPSYGFTINSPESVVPGYADLLLYQAGITVNEQPDVVCAQNLTISSSNDSIVYNDDRLLGLPVTFLGLRDCDKVYMGLNPSEFSFNGSGIPDYVQMRCGLNPLDKNEAFVSTAGDGVANIDKCKRHIPIAESANTTANQLFSYVYSTTFNTTNDTTTLTISNIPILNTGAENLITFYVTETNSTTNATSLYTAYALLKAGYSGKTLLVNYWATAPATFFNQEILVP